MHRRRPGWPPGELARHDRRRRMDGDPINPTSQRRYRHPSAIADPRGAVTTALVALMAVIVVTVCRLGGAAHHAHHRYSPGGDEPDDQRCRDNKKDDVEPGGVVPRDRSLHDRGGTLGWDEIRCAKDQFDEVPGGDHCGVKSAEQRQHHPGAVVLAVDVQDRQDQQVGVDQRDHTAEADASVAFHRTVSPRSAWRRAASMSLERTKSRNSTASTTIISGPPTNSAAVNCQPISRARMMPNSTTRLVEPISKAMAAVKLAPLRNSDRARATAAYEHDEDAAPSPAATARVRGRSSPNSATMLDRRTMACTTADRAKPRISAQRISHVMDPASANACPTAPAASFTTRPPLRISACLGAINTPPPGGIPPTGYNRRLPASARRRPAR